MPDQFVFQTVAEWVSRSGQGASRSDVAKNFRFSLSTARYHLDKCVTRGLLVRAYTWTSGSSRGWVYYSPNLTPQGLTPEEEMNLAEGQF